MTLLGFGLGLLIRGTAGALSAVFATLFALKVIVGVLPTTWQPTVANYLPVDAGAQIMTTVNNPHALPPWAGLGVLCLYVAVTTATAAAIIGHRDI